MKIGIYGGTFDPVHLGHVSLAKQVKKKMGLDKLIVIVANVSPAKVDRPPVASAKRRLEMARLAFQGIEGVEVSSVEVDREEVSYTIDTVKILREAYPTEDFYLIVGPDEFEKFSDWNEADQLENLTEVVFVVDNKKEISSHAKRLCPIEWIPVCSTILRKKLKDGEKCQKFISPEVLDYIAKHQLYSRPYDSRK